METSLFKKVLKKTFAKREFKIYCPQMHALGNLDYVQQNNEQIRTVSLVTRAMKFCFHSTLKMVIK